MQLNIIMSFEQQFLVRCQEQFQERCPEHCKERCRSVCVMIMSTILLLILQIRAYAAQVWNQFGNMESNSNNLEKIGRNKYVCEYTFQNNKYKILLTLRKGPNKITLIENEHHDDVTDQVTPYLGPNVNCHHQNINPKDLGFEALTFTTHEDAVIHFSADEPILLEH